MLYTGTYTRRRYSARSIDAATGYPTTASTTDTEFQANVQPLTGEALMRLEEGQRARKPVLVMTTAELRTMDASTNTQPDVVVIGGVEHEVISVEQFTVFLPHFEAVAIRRSVPA